jgi:hypothetical protein
MNTAIEVSGADIYNVCANTKYNSCPELSESGPTFTGMEFEIFTNLYTGIYILFI